MFQLATWCTIWFAFTAGCPDDPYCRQCSDRIQVGMSLCITCQYSFLNDTSGQCDPKPIVATNNCETYKWKMASDVALPALPDTI